LVNRYILLQFSRRFCVTSLDSSHRDFQPGAGLTVMSERPGTGPPVAWFLVNSSWGLLADTCTLRVSRTTATRIEWMHYRVEEMLFAAAGRSLRRRLRRRLNAKRVISTENMSEITPSGTHEVSTY
jgi:hypothetical protein